MGEAGGAGEPRKIHYLADFKKRVKRACLYNERLHELLEAGSVLVGKRLQDSIKQLEPEEVLWAVRTRNIKKLVSHCRKLVRCRRLYEEWLRCYDCRSHRRKK